jgi:predicted DNA-binding protein YlxM (UPF0122 family)
MMAYKRVTEDVISEIVSLYADTTLTYSAIAEKIGFSRRSVTWVIKGSFSEEDRHTRDVKAGQQRRKDRLASIVPKSETNLKEKQEAVDKLLELYRTTDLNAESLAKKVCYSKSWVRNAITENVPERERLERAYRVQQATIKRRKELCF